MPPRVLAPAELMKHVPLAEAPALAEKLIVAVEPGWNAWCIDSDIGVFAPAAVVAAVAIADAPPENSEVIITRVDVPCETVSVYSTMMVLSGDRGVNACDQIWNPSPDCGSVESSGIWLVPETAGIVPMTT